MNVGRFAMHNVRVVITAVLLIALIGLGAGNYAFGSAAGAPSDLVGHWAEPQLEQWLKDGLLTGYPDGRVEPDRLLTRAEWMALANRAQGYSATSDIAFSDLSPSAWEYEDARKAVKAGYIIGYGDGTIRSGSSISRQEAAVMLVRMFGLDSKADGAAASRFTDTASIAGWSRAAVSALVGGNLIAGYPDGTFKPKAFVTRAEAVVMLDNAMKTLHSAAPAVYDKPGIYGSVNEMTALEGDVVINAAGVTLQNMNIKGKLILAEGIGEGDVVLNHVTVQGDTRVQGGGEHSIHIADSVMARIIIDKKTGTVRIVVEGSTSAAAVDIQSPAVLEEAAGLSGAGFTAVSLANALPAHSAVTLKGKFDSVTIASSQIEVSVPQGSIDQLTAGSQAQGLSLNVGTDAKIVSMVLDAIVKVLGQGMIEKATLSEHAKGTSFEKQPVQTVDTSSQAPASNYGGSTGDNGGGTGDSGDGPDNGGGTGDNGDAPDNGGGTGDNGDGPDNGGGTGDNGNGPDNGGGTGDNGDGPDNGGVGSVVFYSKNDASIPQVLGDYDQILAGTKKIDAAFTMRASVLAVGSGGIVSCFDQAGKMWVGSGTELKRFDAYSMDKSQTELFAQETYVKGQIKALLVDGGYMWVLTDQSVSRIRYQ